MAQVGFGFQARLLGVTQVVLQLSQTLLAVLDALLHPGDIAAHRVETPLHLIEALRQLMMAVAQPFDAGVGIALLGHQRFETNLLVADHLLALPDLLVQSLPAQRRQLRLELTFLGLVFLVLLGRLRLTMQAFQLTLQLFAQVGQARQVLMGAADAVLGFAATLLVLGNPRSLLDEDPQVFRLGLDQLGDHALLDDRVAARPQAGAEKDVSDVATAALGAVEEVGVLRVAGHAAANGDFRERGVLAGEGAVGVVEDQLDAGLGNRLAGVGAVEDDIRHRLAAQVLRRTLAHHPAHGIDDVGFAAAIGADHRRHVAGEAHRGRVDEGFEARELDAFQSHVGLSVAVSLRSDERNSPCIRSGSLSIVGGSHRARSLSRRPGALAAGCAAYFTATGGYAFKEPARLLLCGSTRARPPQKWPDGSHAPAWEPGPQHPVPSDAEHRTLRTHAGAWVRSLNSRQGFCFVRAPTSARSF